MFLGVGAWRDFSISVESAPPCVIDLRRIARAYPPGVVAALLVARHRHDLGRETRICLPSDSDILNYLERIDFFSSIEPYTSIEPDVSYLHGNRRNPTDRFTPILTPDGTGFSDASSVIWKFFQDHFPRSASIYYTPFEEILANVRDHSLLDSERAAFNCLQVQIYRGSIELAFGDLGVGFRASLGSNPHLPAYETEAGALRGAILERQSRFTGEDRARGGGLRQAFDVVHRLGGIARIQTRNGLAFQQSKDPSPLFQTALYEFPGTLVWMRIPTPDS